MPRGVPAISVDRLTRTYGAVRAVDDLTFAVERGEVFALLGRNGAGKTTTVEILEGYRQPDAGTVRVLGLDPARDRELKGRIGVMPQEGGLYPAITPREALAHFSRFYQRPRDPNEVLQLVGLSDSAGTRYRRLSGGQKQRLSLALALLPRPEVIFLDEPTAGLDPQARRETWELIRSLRADETTVLLTTHYLEEAERLADRALIINHGRLVAVGTPRELTHGDRTAVRIRTAGPGGGPLLERLPAAASVRTVDGDTYLVETQDAQAVLVQAAACLRDAGIEIVELRVGFASLEEVFLALTEETVP